MKYWEECVERVGRKTTCGKKKKKKEKEKRRKIVESSKL